MNFKIKEIGAALVIIGAFGIVGEMDYQDEKALENIQKAKVEQVIRDQELSEIINGLRVDSFVSTHAE